LSRLVDQGHHATASGIGEGAALQRLTSGVLPTPRQEFVERRGHMVGDAVQHIGKPNLRIDSVEFRRGYQRSSK